MKLHSEGKVPCFACGNQYTSARGLREHITLKHERIRKFKRLVCGKAFARANQLEVHNATHLKPMKCEVRLEFDQKGMKPEITEGAEENLISKFKTIQQQTLISDIQATEVKEKKPSKFDWKEDSTPPAGWKGRSKQGTIAAPLDPQENQFKTRRAALHHCIKNKES